MKLNDEDVIEVWKEARARRPKPFVPAPPPAPRAPSPTDVACPTCAAPLGVLCESTPLRAVHAARVAASGTSLNPPRSTS